MFTLFKRLSSTKTLDVGKLNLSNIKFIYLVKDMKILGATESHQIPIQVKNKIKDFSFQSTEKKALAKIPQN